MKPPVVTARGFRSEGGGFATVLVDGVEYTPEQIAQACTRRRMSVGVGDGNGQLFVYGDYDSVKTCQAKLLRAGRIEQAAIELRAAQKAYMADRGNDELGAAVGAAAFNLDVELAL